MNPDEIKLIADRCESVLNLPEARLDDEHFYQSLPFCVIDSVFSMGVNYGSVKKVISKYCQHFGLQQSRSDQTALPPQAKQQSVCDLLDLHAKWDFTHFAGEIYKNRQRTSTRGGILKAEAVFRFAQALAKQNVHFFQDMEQLDQATFERDIKEIPGQKSGISLAYFYMLAGSEEDIKPDRMIIRFLEAVLNRTVEMTEAKGLLGGASSLLTRSHPHLNPRLLDNQIWKFQRQQPVLKKGEVLI